MSGRNCFGAATPVFPYYLDNVLTVQGHLTTAPTLVARAVVSQTADLFQNQDSSENVLSLFDIKGAWHPPHLADAAAQNDSVYFSTTSNKLSYKDNAGVVDALE